MLSLQLKRHREPPCPPGPSRCRPAPPVEVTSVRWAGDAPRDPSGSGADRAPPARPALPPWPHGAHPGDLLSPLPSLPAFPRRPRRNVRRRPPPRRRLRANAGELTSRPNGTAPSSATHNGGGPHVGLTRAGASLPRRTADLQRSHSHRPPTSTPSYRFFPNLLWSLSAYATDVNGHLVRPEHEVLCTGQARRGCLLSDPSDSPESARPGFRTTRFSAHCAPSHVAMSLHTVPHDPAETKGQCIFPWPREGAIGVRPVETGKPLTWPPVLELPPRGCVRRQNPTLTCGFLAFRFRWTSFLPVTTLFLLAGLHEVWQQSLKLSHWRYKQFLGRAKPNR